VIGSKVIGFKSHLRKLLPVIGLSLSVLFCSSTHAYELQKTLLESSLLETNAQKTIDVQSTSDGQSNSNQPDLAKPNSPTTLDIINAYSVTINAPDDAKKLVTTYLELIDKLNNPRLTNSEWKRLLAKSNNEIKDLLATEGYFSPQISQTVTGQHAVFNIEPGKPVLVNQVTINFVGDITQANKSKNNAAKALNIDRLKRLWPLKQKNVFRQADWSEAKHSLLTKLIIQRYPRATLQSSLAAVNPETNQVDLSVTVDSGQEFYFGQLEVHGLNRYSEDIVRNLSKIKSGDEYLQSALLDYQVALQATGKFDSVEVSANTEADANPINSTITVNVTEKKSKTAAIGIGVSTNTGARVELNYTNRNLFDHGWLWDTTTKIEQYSQSIDSQIKLPQTKTGYRDSINNSMIRLDVQGQTTTDFNNGIKRTWGDKKREQFVGANFLFESLAVDNEKTSYTKSTTLAYGITIRHLNNDLFPTSGYLLNTQFQASPFEKISDGRFLQSYAKSQTYYKIAKNTQFVGRLEVGMVSGANSTNVPATFLFRTGGDQSVRGYAFQSLGVASGSSTIGGRVLLTGSLEITQWLTKAWGAAAFVDLGNAAQSWSDYKAVYGYGLGVRWKSPAGPVGLDVAYGEATGEYRAHFNLGVSF